MADFDPEYTKIWEQEVERRAAFLSHNRPDEDNMLYQLIKVAGDIKIKKSKYTTEEAVEKRFLKDIKAPRPPNLRKVVLEKWIWPKSIRNNVCFAGGAPLGTLLKKPSKDVDVFIISDTPLLVLKTILKMKCGFVNWSKNAISINYIRDAECNTLYNVQIILRAYKSVSEVITGFDIDSCCVAYYKNNYYVTPRAKYAIERQTNTVNLALSSTSYEYRLLKYCTRGFGIQLPPDTPKVALEKAYSDSKSINTKFSNTLGWLIWSYLSITYRNRNGYYNLINKPPSDYESNHDNLWKRVSVKNNFVVNVWIREGESDRLFNKYYFEQHPEYNWNEIGKIPTFITVNPGAQNNNWSFKPLNIALQEWFNPDVIRKKTYHQPETTLRNYEQAPLILSYYKYPGPLGVSYLNRGEFIEEWNKEDVVKYCKYYNLPICEVVDEWLNLNPFNVSTSNSWNTPRAKYILNEILNAITDVNRKEFIIQLDYRCNQRYEDKTSHLNSFEIKDIFYPKFISLFYKIRRRDLNTISANYSIPNPYYKIIHFLEEKGYVYSVKVDQYVIIIVHKPYNNINFEYISNPDLKFILDFPFDTELVSNQNKTYKTHVKLLMQFGAYFKSLLSFKVDKNTPNVVNLDYNNVTIELFLDCIYYSTDEWIEKYLKVDFKILDVIKLFDFIQVNDNIYHGLFDLISRKLKALQNDERLDILLLELKNTSEEMESIKEILDHYLIYNMDEKELIEYIVNDNTWDLVDYKYNDRMVNITSNKFRNLKDVYYRVKYNNSETEYEDD